MSLPGGEIRDLYEGGKLNSRRPVRFTRPVAFAAVAVSCSLIAAACGGGGKKAAPTGTTQATLAESTTSSSAVTDTSVATNATTTTAGPTATTAAGNRTATTAPRGKASATTTKAAPIAAKIINVTTTASTAPRTDIQPGGTMVKLATADFNSMDPLFSTASTLDGAPQFAVYDTLMYDDRQANIV